MMYQATEKIKEAFDVDGRFTTFVEEHESYSMVRVIFPGGATRLLHMDFVSTDNGNDVLVYIPGIITVEPEQLRIVLPLLNKFNSVFRPARFYCDKDGDVNVQYDYLVKDEDPAATAVEQHLLLARAARKGAELLAKELKAGYWD